MKRGVSRESGSRESKAERSGERNGVFDCGKIGNIAMSRVVTRVVEPRWNSLTESAKRLV